MKFNCALKRMLLMMVTFFGVVHCQVSSAAEGNVDQSLVDIIGAIEKGWEQGDGAPFESHFLDFEGARYIESGGQNEGLTDLVENHVEPEGHALANFDLVFSNVETHIEGDFAWAIVDVELTATVVRDNRKIHRRGYQTLIFRRVDDEWKVVHTHNSTRSIDSIP